MHFSYISVGGGVTGIETLVTIINGIKKKLNKSKKFTNKKITVAVIDKNLNNIPGGVAYGFENSKYGYFNNPIRLSPEKFTNWIFKKKNRLNLKRYLETHGGYTGQIWLKKNKNFFKEENQKKFDELYVPRTLFNFWMEEKLIKILYDIKKINSKNNLKIEIKFFEGEIIDIDKIKNIKKHVKIKNFTELNYEINKNFLKKLHFFKKKKINEKITTNFINIGLGLPPPKKLAPISVLKNENYIWDFYAEGSTSILIKKILNLKNNHKTIKVYFIGFKAGLLESLPELKQVILKEKIKIKIFCASKNLQSIQLAKLSNKKYSVKFFTKNMIKKINKAEELYLSIIKEFNFAKKNGFKKYDAWTEILKKNILFLCIRNFNLLEKNKYNNIYHNKLRNITRFTYPETIAARDYLIKSKILNAQKEEILGVEIKNKKLKVLSNKKNYDCDIVVNVSGPLNVNTLIKEIPLIESIKKNGIKYNSGGFVVNKNFEINNLRNVYTGGILANAFNPQRQTIIKAILRNSNIVGNNIAKKIFDYIS